MTDSGGESAYCVSLPNATDRNLVGTKGWNLQRALRFGFPVPPGFVVTRHALAGVLTSAGLRYDADRLLAEAMRNPQVLEDSGQRLREALMTAPIPDELMEDIRIAYGTLLGSGTAALAVRSSALHEDSEKASFAGVFQSYLGLQTLEEVVEGIRKCWCSSWTTGAAAYAARLKVMLKADQMAVIVHRMIDPEVAGVTFTADPSTGNPWLLVTEATFGLAEAMMRGAAAADRTVVEWYTGHVLESVIADKTTCLQMGNGGVQTVPVEAASRRAPVLSQEQARTLARMAEEIDRRFGCRVDIEWAFKEGTFFVLQVRPLTALPAFFPAPLDEDDQRWTWYPAKKGEYVEAEPGSSLVAPLFDEVLWFERWRRHQPPDGIRGYCDGVEKTFCGYPYQAQRVWREDELFKLAGAWDEGEAWLDQHEEALYGAWRQQLARMSDLRSKVAEARRRPGPAVALLPLLLEYRDADADLESASWGPPQLLHDSTLALLRHHLEEWGVDVPIENLFAGIHSRNYEKTVAEQELGRSIREPGVARVFREVSIGRITATLLDQLPASLFLQKYDRFCRRFGVAPPAWIHRPARWSKQGPDVQVINAIRSAFLGIARDVRDVRAAAIQCRHAAENSIRAVLAAKPDRGQRFEKTLVQAQRWVSALDERGICCVHGVELDDLIWEVGQRLQREGLLSAPEQILLLRSDAIRKVIAGLPADRARALFEKQVAEYQRNGRLNPPPYLGAAPGEKKSVPVSAPSAPGTAPAPPPSSPDNVFMGVGVSPGVAEGTCRAVGNLEDPAILESLTGKEILVIRGLGKTIDYHADWLSLLMSVRGVVTTWSNMLHHLSHTARECGVPFVNLQVVDPMRLPDGARLRIDGAQGRVEVL